VTLHAPEEHDFSGKTLEEALTCCLMSFAPLAAFLNRVVSQLGPCGRSLMAHDL
jgi:hypothetical protein